MLKITINIIDYPKYFTPNGNGYHGTWNISSLKPESNAKIYIFDRYGKLLKEIRPWSDGWDGTFNGILSLATIIGFQWNTKLMARTN
jgi:gliding motility-associated-like protein